MGLDEECIVPDVKSPLWRSVAINYLSQFYVAILGILMVPLYVRYMGAESYGLVGFFTMTQSWLLLLDMGLSPMLTRELGRFRAGVLSLRDVSGLVRCLEWLFSGMAVLCVLLVIAASPWVASHWLKLERLSADEVAYCIATMGGMISLRWVIGVYRSGFVGLDLQGSLGLLSTFIATLRFVGVFLVLLLVSVRPVAFFSYQLGVAVFELILTGGWFYRLLPMKGVPWRPRYAELLRPRLRFAGSMAYLAILWGVVTQIDKLALSHWLDLPSYGYFSVAITLASGITMFSIALAQSLQPRLVSLVAAGEAVRAVQLYRLGTQLAAALLISIAGVMAFQAEPLLLVWTGNALLAAQMAPVLGLYALGNAIYALQGVAFLMQFARGVTRWQVVGSTVFAFFWVPVLLVCVVYFGAFGAGVIWLVGNLLFVLGWTTWVHGRIAPELKWRWLGNDVLMVALAALIPAMIAGQFDLTDLNRIHTVILLCAIGGASVLLGLVAGNQSRTMLLAYARRCLFSTK